MYIDMVGDCRQRPHHKMTHVDRLEGLDDVQLDQPFQGFPQNDWVHADHCDLPLDSRETDTCQSAPMCFGYIPFR